jgi:hypothetical protein
MSNGQRLRDPVYQRVVADLVQGLGENGLSSLATLSFLLQPQTPGLQHTNCRIAPRHAIGIWDADPNDAMRFRRANETADEWRYWADESEIVLRSGSFRVALIGESAARGYLLDPAYTPAKVLEFMLTSASQEIADARPSQVIDLARTDLSPDGFDVIVDSLSFVRPDVVVVFIGNNVSKIKPPDEWRPALADALQQGDFPSLQRVFRDEVMPLRCGQSLDKLARTLGAECDVVVVVPEFNLLAWQETDTAGLPWLAPESVGNWMAARTAAREALSSAEMGRLRAAGSTLTTIDGGTGWYGHWCLAEAARREGKAAEARTHFEEARDSRIGMFIPHTPRCPNSVQQTLRAKAREHGFALVDLPAILGESAESGLPDSQFFLDYCHLSAEGVEVSMRAVAERILPRRNGSLRGSLTSHLPAPPLDPRTRANSHILAAIHNSHYGQCGSIMEEHVARAIDADPGVVEVIEAIVDFQVEDLPNWACNGFAIVSRSPQLGRYFRPDDSTINSKFEDNDLTAAFESALRRTGGCCAANPIRRLVQSLGAKIEQDLLRPVAHARSFRAFHGYAYEDRCAFHRVHDTVSRFRFSVPKPADYVLSVCFRASTEIDSTLQVSVNQRHVGTFACTRRWSAVDVLLPAEHLALGINWLELSWPAVAANAVRSDRLAVRIRRGEGVDSLAWYGELFRCTVRRQQPD